MTVRVFLIEALEVDSMENNIAAALRWVPTGFTLDEVEAERIVESGGVFKASGWPLSEDAPKFQYRELSSFEFQDHDYPYYASGQLRECSECGLHHLAHPDVDWERPEVVEDE